MNTNKPLSYDMEGLSSLLCRLFVRGAVKIDTEVGFTLHLHQSNPDAPLSPVYFNLRVPENKGGPLNQMDVREIAEFFYAYLISHNIEYDAICPVPNAGDPFAKALQKVIRDREGREVHLFELEKIEESGKRHIGKLKPTPCTPAGARVLLLDDLISEATSKVEAVTSLLREGCIVSHCLVFLDREQGGSLGLLKHKVILHSIVGVSNVLEIYKDKELITHEQYGTVRAYLHQ